MDELKQQYQAWLSGQRMPELIVFQDDFAQCASLAQNWSATISGDDSPAGTATIALLTEPIQSTTTLPAALIKDGRLLIIEGGTAGDKWLSTRQVIDWTPEGEGEWIQASFDLVDNKVDPAGTPAETDCVWYRDP